MHSFTVAIINGSYMFQLQSSKHQAVYVRNINGNFVVVGYNMVKNDQRKILSVTYKGT
jgi:hypothetical protein